jgi:hypothetical protein
MMPEDQLNGTMISWVSKLLELKDTASLSDQVKLKALCYISANDVMTGEMISQGVGLEFGCGVVN